ncbi:MAG: RelA/SpoT family protein [Candidatus Kapabacteria bacterium]|nr:RelA/SpoT family protein [Candidatus Kapabacteria bacterium]
MSILTLPFGNKTKTEENSNHKFGLDVQSDLTFLLKECKTHLNKFNEQKIRKAFMMCLDAHENQIRNSGDPYYTHPLEVARIVLKEIPLDETSVIAALLHDVPDQGDVYHIKDIRLEFGSTVANIVENIYRIGHIENNNLPVDNQAENYRKLLISLFRDVRIILIKLADRLHNMRTLEYLPEESRIKLSKETMDIYAPFANRFGLRNLKWELEDLAFKYLNQEAYEEIRTALNLSREEREEYIKQFIKPIEERLAQEELLKKLKIKFTIDGRPKHLYSIYNKMRSRSKSINELYDLFAVRVNLDNKDPFLCHYVYGVVASIYMPVPETFKDYINNPKRNGYQSIHSAVVGLNNRIVEIQVRNISMHDIAEKGLAAHFIYKNQVGQHSILEKKQIMEWVQVVRSIFENAGLSTNEDVIKNVRNNFLLDEIYVYTPNNEFRTLPKDSTPLDFAFDIHTQIGYSYIGAKVNGKIVPIEHKLESGDIVEILTSEHPQPKSDWLQYLVTPKAKSAIIKYLKDEEKRNIIEGKKIWNTKLQEYALRIADDEIDKVAISLQFPTKEDLFLAIAKKKIDFERTMEFIKYKLKDGFKIGNELRKIVEKSSSTILSSDNYLHFTEKFDAIEFERNDRGLFELTINVSVNNNIQILEEMNSKMISVNDIELKSLSYQSEGNILKERIELLVPDKKHIKMIFENIWSVHGVILVEIDKNKN